MLELGPVSGPRVIFAAETGLRTNERTAAERRDIDRNRTDGRGAAPHQRRGADAVPEDEQASRAADPARDGEAWIAKYVSEGSIVSLGLLHPDGMAISMAGNRVTYTVDGQGSYGPEDIIFIRGLCSDGLRGMSPISYARGQR